MRLALILLVLSGCGSAPPCTGQSTGMWKGVTAKDSLWLGDTCGLLYTGSDGCAEQGTYATALGHQGRVNISITTATAGACMRPGSYSCSYTATSSALSYDCGGGPFNYVR